MNTLQEFYDFFSNIPDDKWNVGSLTKGDTHCALGQLGETAISYDLLSHDAQVLTDLLAHSKAIPVTTKHGMQAIVWHINDGCYFKEVTSPKERILFAIKLAMDSESITEFLNELMFELQDAFDIEYGLKPAASAPPHQISEAEFKSLIDNSIPQSITDSVGVSFEALLDKNFGVRTQVESTWNPEKPTELKQSNQDLIAQMLANAEREHVHLPAKPNEQTR